MLWAPLCSKLNQYGAVRLVLWILSIGWTQRVMGTWIPDSHFWILYMQVSWVQMFTHVTAEGGVTMLSSCAELMSMELQQKPRLWRRVLLHDKSVTSMEPLSEYGRGLLWEFLKVFGLAVNFYLVFKRIEVKWGFMNTCGLTLTKWSTVGACSGTLWFFTWNHTQVVLSFLCCFRYHAIHKDIYNWFDIDFDKFGRTSTPQQTEIAQAIFMSLYEKKRLNENTMTQVCMWPISYLSLTKRLWSGI